MSRWGFGMADRRYPPNRLLAWERLQRGWSYEEVADRIRREMDRVHEPYTGLSANTVRRWEIGERWPEPRYRKHLVTLFGKPASELGLLTQEELSQRPQAESYDEFRRLWDVLKGGESHDGWDRATVLRAMLGVGVLPLVSPSLTLDPGEAEAGHPAGDPRAYAQIVRCQRDLYWSSPAGPLFEAAYAHTRLGIGLVRGAARANRIGVASALAEAALLTARLAFFDLRQRAVADRCFDVALAATREAGDHALAAAVLGHMAFVPGFGHESEQARTLVAAALQHSWHGVSPVMRSWLHCVASEIEARARAGAASRHHIDLAEAALATNEPKPEWLDFYDADRLHSFAGYAALAAGDHAGAVERLERSLAMIGPRGAKQRSVILADLATAHGTDTDRAAHYLDQALDALHTEWYGTGLDRILAVRPILGDSNQGQQIDERIALLAAETRAALPGG